MCTLNPFKASNFTLGFYFIVITIPFVCVLFILCIPAYREHLSYETTTCKFVYGIQYESCKCYQTATTGCSKCYTFLSPCYKLISLNVRGSCCTSDYCCRLPCQNECCAYLYSYLGYVDCHSCPKNYSMVQFECPNGTCCSNLIKYYSGQDFQLNSVFPCYYRNDSLCLTKLSLSWNLIDWFSTAILGVVLVLLLQIISWRIGHAIFPKVERCKAITAYLFFWWIVIFPISSLVPSLTMEPNKLITSDVQWYILLVTCIIMGIVLIIIVLINEKSKKNRKYTIISAISFAFSVGLIPIMVGHWGQIISFVILVIIFSFAFLGIVFGLISTKIQGVLRPMYKPAFESIRAHIVTSKELADQVKVSPSTFRKDLMVFVDNPKFSDIQFRVKNFEVVYAHRIILYVRAPNLLVHLNSRENKDEPQLDYPKIVVLKLLELIYAGETFLPGKFDQRNQILEDLVELEKSFQLNLFKKVIKDYLTGESRQENLASEDFVYVDLNHIVLPYTDLICSYKEALDNPKYGDAIIILDSIEIPDIHKVLLAARSTFFDSLFNSNWSSRNNTGRYHISIPHEVFVVIQNYIYTDTISEDLSGDIVIGVLNESELLGLTSLFQYCEKYIAARLTNGNVQEIYTFCEEYSIPQLKKVCEYYSNKKQKILEMTPLLVQPPNEEEEEEEIF